MTTCRVLQLGQDPLAARQARAFVRQALGPDVGEDVLQDALLVVSELVTNCVRHAGTPSELEVRVGPHTVEVRLSDRDHRLPVCRDVSADLPTGGRGLHLLGALTQCWGTDRRPDGKTVWAHLRRA